MTQHSRAHVKFTQHSRSHALRGNALCGRSASGALSLILAIILLFGQATFGHELKSLYLKNPELNHGFVDSCAQFWLSSYDTVYGGFFSNVNQKGAATDLDFKTMLTQSRNAYGMVRAFMMTGDTTYLPYARGALDFMYTHAWDAVNSGWYNVMDREGAILPEWDHNKVKWSFMQHYALLGICAMVEATGNPADQEMLMKGCHANEAHLWDARAGFEGYYDIADTDWSNPRDKGFTPTVDGITTHALSMALMDKTEPCQTRFLQLADHVVLYMIPTMDEYSLGFTESFDSNWTGRPGSFYFIGHMLKSAWCLTRAYLMHPDSRYLQGSGRILDTVYDTVAAYFNGEWWEWEQAFMAGIMNYYISGNTKYLGLADHAQDFFMRCFVDHAHGEVYGRVGPGGTPYGTDKGGYWKAGYHSIEQGYYGYLYGNLYLHRKPVHLYYKFNASNEARSIALRPLAIEDDYLKVTAVQLNGETHDRFDRDSRTLEIPKGTGGIFRVTFENLKPATGVPMVAVSPSGFDLEQNSPNPFNPVTQITYRLSTAGAVHLVVYDLNGRQVRVLADGEQTAGTHTVRFDGFGLSSGVYLACLKAEGRLTTRKMMLVR